MLKIITLICALAGLLSAVVLEAWLRSRIERNDASAESYAEVKSRYSEFWSIQYGPILIMVALISAAIFLFVGHLNAAVFLGGAVLCFVSVITGSLTVVTGSIAPSSTAVKGDIRNALKTSFRSGAVMGLFVSSIALIGLGVLFFLLKTEQLVSLIASFALGASVVSICLGISGTAFSGAYSITVRSDDFTDYSGMFIGSGADHVETYILSACAAALLAEAGVDTSGVMSTFTATSAARFPLIILATGIAASVIGVMTYRGRIVKNPAAGLTAGNYVAAVLIIAVSLYFSNRILQSYIYSICVATGMAAALAAGEVARAFSADGYVFRRNLPDIKRIGAGQSMIYSLSIGMMSVIIPALLTTAALIIDYKFAGFYGIALGAVGITSLTAVNSAVRGFSINTASASDIASLTSPDAESPNPADVLLTASARSDAVGKTYSSIASYMTLFAMFTALSVVSDNMSTNLLTLPVIIGVLIGAVVVFISAGLIIRSIRLTSQVLRGRLEDSDDPEKRINSLRGLFPVYAVSLIAPLASGAAGGVNGLIAFACSACITGMCVTFAFNDSGRFFDRTATETLGTIIKFMVAVTLVFTPVFMEFGGIF
ncbi:MAG: sodium/proton-translocating pyrophosphatase [Clostridiales bacterium]|nr:sodium/proton-translocating pyrophosphatase [Clostridiales bacterium]MBR0468233.1 sodium/proton-translocating pyrophosphatase [Mogibacterium sp.]